MDIWESIDQHISQARGRPFTLQAKTPVGGGCINEGYRIGDGTDTYFVKLNAASGLAMFEAEAEGLHEMARAQAIRVPLPLVAGKAAGRAFLVMEYIALTGRTDPAALGEQLAALHRKSHTHYGWHRDNTIGSTAQINTYRDDWIDFYREQRLGFQLHLAHERGGSAALLDKGRALMEALPAFFSTYRAPPSLLHGDLWGGNWAGDAAGNPVIFDPAPYYGDRECDLAMTELFGGPGPDFYAAYDAAWSIDPGYGVRKTLYNLYHILNHYNLFGGGYAAQAERMTDRLLSEVR